jgi:hypothetical protein
MTSDAATADRLIRRRARMLPVLGIFFILGPALHFTDEAASSGPAKFRIGAWLVWAIVLLLALAFAGRIGRGRAVQALVEDENTIANRLRGYAAGFWAAALTTLAIYILSTFETVSGREAARLILTVAIGAAVIRFGLLERRALRDG